MCFWTNLDCTSFQSIRGSTCICWGRRTLRVCIPGHTELVKHSAAEIYYWRKQLRSNPFTKPHSSGNQSQDFPSYFSVVWKHQTTERMTLRMEYFHVLHSTEKFPTIDTCNLVTKLIETLITFTVSFAVLLPSVAALESAAVPAHACQTPRRDLPSFSFRKTAGTGQFFTKTRFNNVTRQKHWGRPSEDHRFEGKGVPYGGLWGLTLRG